MRVIFVAAGSEQLSVSLLSAILRRDGHVVGLAFSRRLFDDKFHISIAALAKAFDDDDVVDQVVKFRPDVVCFSAVTVYHRWMVNVARRVKDQCGAFTVFGGVHPSAVPEVVLKEPSVDFVVVGEGDVALPLLLQALSGGRRDLPVPNVVGRGLGGNLIRGPRLPLVPDLDQLPGFEKDLWTDHVRLDANYMTMSARGCPYRCSFCFNNFFAALSGTPDSYVRQRSVGHFVNELREAKRRYKVRYVDIVDDIFTLDTSWIENFSREYRKEVGLPFQCISHVHFLDEPRIRALKEAGCAWVTLAVESADDSYKKTKLRRYEDLEAVDRALGLLHKYRIKQVVDHIFGFPGESIASQDRALAFYRKNRPTRVNTLWLKYLPGTEMMDQAVRWGELSRSDADKQNEGYQNILYDDKSVTDPALRKKYIVYEFLIRILPALPSWVPLPNPDRMAWIPAPLLKWTGFAVDFLVHVVHRNPRLMIYFYVYWQGLRNHFHWRLSRLRKMPRGAIEMAPLRDPAWSSAFGPAHDVLSDAAPTKP